MLLVNWWKRRLNCLCGFFCSKVCLVIFWLMIEVIFLCVYIWFFVIVMCYLLLVGFEFRLGFYFWFDYCGLWRVWIGLYVVKDEFLLNSKYVMEMDCSFFLVKNMFYVVLLNYLNGLFFNFEFYIDRVFFCKYVLFWFLFLKLLL